MCATPTTYATRIRPPSRHLPLLRATFPFSEGDQHGVPARGAAAGQDGAQVHLQGAAPAGRDPQRAGAGARAPHRQARQVAHAQGQAGGHPRAAARRPPGRRHAARQLLPRVHDARGDRRRQDLHHVRRDGAAPEAEGERERLLRPIEA
ncbi:hypothetical protein ON010_g6201 [Phytophthora cinnamomi]|nr:hypothetical protein ON010_g6201 [Phytophthora cinnamomi]